MIKLLVIAGADINATDSDEWTPLHVAASWSLISAIKALLVLGKGNLDFDAITNNGETAMDFAVLDNDGHDEVIRSRFSEVRISDLDEMQSQTE